VAASSTLSRRLSEFLGVALFGIALIWLIALLTYQPADPVPFLYVGPRTSPANFIGPAGALLSALSFQLLGFASYLIPGILMVIGWQCFWCRPVDAVYTKLVGASMLFACVSSFLSLALRSDELTSLRFRPGGEFGAALEAWLVASFGRSGSLIIIVTFFFLALILSTQFSFGRMFAGIIRVMVETWKKRVAAFASWREERRRVKQRREVVEKHTKRAAAESKAGATAVGADAAEACPQPIPAVKPTNGAGAPQPDPARQPPAPTVRRPSITPQASGGDGEPLSKTSVKRGAYTLPPTALLDAPKTERKIDEHELMDAARQLEEKCREFAVEGNVVQIHPGPVVTTFEFKPEAGVKYSKITSLADDLSLALRAESVLIERTPGKSTVGIQIPNPNREPISLRELLESDAYRRSGSKLTLALGKTIHGEPFLTDLSTMPHLLIAGSTGTGKSVAINAMLTSILFRATPDDVRLILIDPKRLELEMYEDIPHLLTPVVVEPKQAANALGWAVKEMEERYKTLAAEGVRNIEQYNRNMRHALEEQRTQENGDEFKPLPYIVVVIDELADLMMMASTEVEESIARLAQMARAVGIHLILATQRPSVDVITGLIKANLPARISFRVSSKVDSRTILDGNGAEQLLGKGDMLFLPPASSRLIRLHGPYISEQESARLAGFLRKQGKPVYDETVTAEDKAADAIAFEKDDLYDEAARIVVGSGQASISYLQRRLRIGFSRAARLVDMMEAEGLVSPAAGGKPRDVLVDKNYFDEVDSQLR
jgi:S-DNA-T family DNA segregation ATPase FtsK/SpoIIIE